MADLAHVCVLVCLFVIVHGIPITGKGLLCRDPDTGKLHHINSTWTSKSFCGNYTCKLKRKNLTVTEYVPYREFHVVKTQPKSEMFHNEIRKVLSKQNFKKENTADMIVNNSDYEDSNDRYLTEEEIKTIIEILQKVKKSELDNLLETYSLAQEIFNEMDKTTTESDVDDTTKYTTDKFTDHKKIKSYWYEPKLFDMHLDSSNVVTEHAQNPNAHSYPYYQIPTPYDFHVSDYYFPYDNKIHTYPNVLEIPKNAYYSNPGNYLYPWLTAYVKPASETVVESDKLLPYPFAQINKGQSHLKLQNQPFVWSSNDIYRRVNLNPLTLPSVNLNPVPSNLQLRHDKEAVSKEYKDAVDLKEVPKPESEKSADEKQTNWKTHELSPDILEEVKANINANRLVKPISFRNKVKLEKVGKVIKVEDQSRKKRDIKISSDPHDKNSVAYEAYLVKTECVTFLRTLGSKINPTDIENLVTLILSSTFEGCHFDTDPGFFQKGDEKQHYPDCCPIRINMVDIHTD